MTALTQPQIRKLLKEIRLERGAHSPDHTFCVMEAVAYVAGEKWSDHPQCASPVITKFCVSWNDAMNDEDRQILKPYIPKIVGTRADAATERRRSYMALDWHCRASAPTWLRAAGLVAEAEAIEATAPIVDAKTATAAQKALDEGVRAARAAWAAARAAARAAAWDAARAAAGDAVRAAAWDAAWHAAWHAAWVAAWVAAWDAAWDAAGVVLRPTVVKLQRSALKLLERMIEA